MSSKRLQNRRLQQHQESFLGSTAAGCHHHTKRFCSMYIETVLPSDASKYVRLMPFSTLFFYSSVSCIANQRTPRGSVTKKLPIKNKNHAKRERRENPSHHPSSWVASRQRFVRIYSTLSPDTKDTLCGVVSTIDCELPLQLAAGSLSTTSCCSECRQFGARMPSNKKDMVVLNFFGVDTFT